MSRIFTPTVTPEDWRRLLVKPDRHWKTGYSAKTLAYCWESADGIPKELVAMLEPHGGKVELLLALPEYKVRLPGSARGESQSDIFVLARVGETTFAITVEGKVLEPFGETICEWLKGASAGKLQRLRFMAGLLGLEWPLPKEIHYQLLHRTASAVIEAGRFGTNAAAMVVHSFSAENLWLAAFQQFALLFGIRVGTNELVAVRPAASPPLYIGWACGDRSFLTK